MKTLLVAFTFLVSVSAQAASIGTCEGLDSIGNLIGQTKSFANGAVKVAYVSTEEPAAAPDHLLIFVYGEEMSITCASVDAWEGAGFASLDMSKMTSSYDANKGLLISFPARIWMDSDQYKTEIVNVRVNRSNFAPVFTLE